MKTLKFIKMHGLGNDFMVVNGIGQDFDPLTAPLAEWSDRFRGVGFDQLLLVEKPSSDARGGPRTARSAQGTSLDAQCRDVGTVLLLWNAGHSPLLHHR